MPLSNSNHWRTDPEYIELLNYLIKRTENVGSPMSTRQVIREYKEKSGAAQTVGCLRHRIINVQTIIHSFEHIDKKAKVKFLFALSGSVDADFLKELEKDAFVEVDEKKRITHYRANDGSLKFRGDHSHSAKTKNAKNAKFQSERNLRSLIRDYFEKKNKADAVPKNEKEKEIWNLIEFITEKCENADSPLNIRPLARDFNQHSGTSRSFDCTCCRVKSYCREIHNIELIDTHSKVRQLFCLSVKLDSDCLERLRTEALVETDEKSRITYYKATDGSLELRGDHSSSAKNRTAQFESKRSHRSLINNYFKEKNFVDAVPKNDKEKEMGIFIEFITEKCENVDSPLNIPQLTKDFNKHLGISRSLDCIKSRIRSYCREIQKIEFLDTNSTVKQLFCLSAKLNWEHLEKLRKTAVVEVDQENRIIKYISNDGSLTLRGSYWGLETTKARRVEKKNKNIATMSDYSEEESEDERLDGNSDDYSSEEFDSEFDSDDDNDHLNEKRDFMEQSKETNDFNSETPVRSRSEMSIYKNFDFDLPTKRSHRSKEIEMREFVEEETNSEITENGVIKTRSGRLSKKRHLDSNFSYDLADSSSLGGLMGSSSSYSKHAKHFHPLTVIEMKGDDGRKRKNISPTAAIPRKMRNGGTTGFSSSKQIGLSSNDSMRSNESDDYDTIYSIDNQVKLEPFRGSIQEDFDEFNEDEDIQLMPKPHQALDEHNQVEEVPIKEEQEEHVEVKPETSHNSKIKFFGAMQSLIVCLDNPSLSWIQSKIHQKIEKFGGSDEVILNDEIVVVIELLISRMSDHSVVNLSETAESVNFSSFLCYLKAAILNSKICGVEDLVKNISELIEESHNKRISMEKVANVLRSTLDIDGF